MLVQKQEEHFRSYTIQSETLTSCYTVVQTGKTSLKAWIGYTNENNKEHERMKYYASVIHKLIELLDAGIIS